MTFQKIIKVTCPFLFAAYLDKVDSHKVSLQSEEPSLSNKILQFATLEEIQISCTILMLDILLKQMDLQIMEKHAGINNWVGQKVSLLLKNVNVPTLMAHHNCNDISECTFCESTVIWYQLSLQLLTYIAPQQFIATLDVSI
uniref:Uncharacterized protein n=1 Tax=Trichogramma kaykai TaxID=54128 RepID=A0ABD2W3A9_9HYME